jgi:four helix bundle protein
MDAPTRLAADAAANRGAAAENVLLPPADAVPVSAAIDLPVAPPFARLGPAVALDAEKLLAYRVALELQVLCGTLVPAHHRVLQDQLERASLSIVTNVAEGAGRRSLREKRHFYMIARGSATETAAIVDVLRLRRLAPDNACLAARTLAVRVVQLLTRLGAALG